MKFYPARRPGRPRAAVAALFSVVAAAGMVMPGLAATPHTPKNAHKKPSAKSAAFPPVRLGKALPPVQTLLVRDGLDPMGTNNGVRLWVLGDASHANLRIRLLAPSRTASAASAPLPRDEWLSEPIPISFTGWHEVVLPKSNFTLRPAVPMPLSLDLSLPADAQVAGDPDTTAPDWAAANGLALDVVAARQTTLVVDDIAWVTLDDKGQGTASTEVIDFETGNVGAWKPVGTDEETAAVTYGVTTQPSLVHGGRVAFRMTVTPPALGRNQQRIAAQRVIADSTKPYLIWTPATLLSPILPDSLPPASGANSEITLTACADQTEAATFCLYSPDGINDVAASIPADLQGIGHILPRSVVDVRVVKVRTVSGAGPLRDPDTAGLGGALLVKDDRALLSGPAPEARLTGPAVCDIPADTSKQFWVTVSVPRNTPPGSYVGRVALSGPGLPPSSVRLTLNVLPLRLLSPAKQYGIDLRSRLDPAPSALPSPDGKALVTDFVTKDALDRQLQDIVAHGFDIASLYDSPDTLWDALTEYRTFGLGSAYNLYKGIGDPQTVEGQRGAHSASALNYYTDPEPNGAALTRMGPLAKAGLPSVTYIPRQADYDALSSDADIVVYSRDSEYAQQLLRTGGKRTSMTRDWWYWPASADTAKSDRVSCGFLLWRANLYGAFLPDYQTAFGADPYDESCAGACASKAAFRPLMLTYPVKDGVLDTLAWEACREGVTDVRYLTTMYAALRECKDAHIAKPLVAEAEGYVKTFLDKPLANLPDDQYDLARARIADYAIKLRAAVDTYNKAHGIR